MGDLVSKICSGAPDLDYQRALTAWQYRAPDSEPPEVARGGESIAWKNPIDERVCSHILSRFSFRDVERLLASSSLLFTGIPSSRDGTHLSDSALTCTVGLRLGAYVAAAFTCVCGALLYSLGDHALSCSRGAGRHARHREIKLRIRKALASCGLASTLEPIGLDVADRRGHHSFLFARSRDGVGRDSFTHVRAHLFSLNCQQRRCSHNACRSPQGK